MSKEKDQSDGGPTRGEISVETTFGKDPSPPSRRIDIPDLNTTSESGDCGMGRPLGQHNEDYEQKRELLLERLTLRLVTHTDRASFREMAAAAGVSMPTLRHYFQDRNGVLKAWLEWKGRLGRKHLASIAISEDSFAESIRSLLTYVLQGMERGQVTEIHVVGLSEGLTNPALGPIYLQSILEPTLAATELRLGRHVERGEMRTTDTRAAALALISPLILAVLHQRDLGGKKVRCLDLKEFVENHAEAFVLAYSPPDHGRRPGKKRS